MVHYRRFIGNCGGEVLESRVKRNGEGKDRKEGTNRIKKGKGERGKS